MLVRLSKYMEYEHFDIEAQVFMVKKQLGYEAQVSQ